nr:beta-galactosidase 3-like [Tanacetum cinerariifolium]
MTIVKWVLLIFLLSQMGWFQMSECCVTYDGTPEMWENLIMKAKEGGLD